MFRFFPYLNTYLALWIFEMDSYGNVSLNLNKLIIVIFPIAFLVSVNLNARVDWVFLGGGGGGLKKKVNNCKCISFCLLFLSRDIWYKHGYRMDKIFDL